jgi:hypothetical protein
VAVYFKVLKQKHFWNRALGGCLLVIAASSCKQPEFAATADDTSSQRYASGTKAVKVITSKNVTTGSFTNPSAVPVATPIPSPYPGYDGSTTYLPGVSASTFFNVDGTTSITKPSWLQDIQVGVTGVSTSAACAKFGDGANSLDVSDYYRTSEVDCTVGENGTGTPTDPVFIRILLDRDTAVLGSAENLMVQIEYQASGLHLNTDGIEANVEDNVDQLWKVFWNSTLGSGSSPNPFSVFVPPHYGACLQSGTGIVGAPGNCVVGNSYRGGPIQTKQILIPLSAYPTLKVIQISRVRSRITSTTPYDYVPNYCLSSNSPYCLGVVVRSITLMRL